MNKDYLIEFLPDLEDFKEKTMKFHNKEISVAEYKGFSGGYGSYAQRGGDKHMLRLRMAGGRLTKERMKFLADTCEKYHIDLIKLTTCQSIQLHNLEAADLCEIIGEAWEAGMISRGGGGDFPRNVMASSLSGVDKNEYFDVLPYAEATAKYMMSFIKTVKLPRKLKIAFSNSPSNETHATFRDLGFVAKENGTFDVYIAGGLGNNPLLGVLVDTDVDPSDILYYANAMIKTFVKYGNYEKRTQARTRYMQKTLGKDGLIKAFHEELAKLMDHETIALNVSPIEVTKKGVTTSILDKRLIPQKQNGLYSVFFHPVGGVWKPEQISSLYHVIENMDQVEIRITPEEGLYVINCNGEEAVAVLEATKDGASTVFETSVACIGNAICQVGLRDSNALLNSCIDAVAKENFVDGVLPKIHISGCPSSCGTHQIGSIGFRGIVKPTADGPKPAFAIFVGGTAKQNEEILATQGKPMLVEEIPAFLVELGRIISASNSTYDEWIKGNQEMLSTIIKKYTD